MSILHHLDQMFDLDIALTNLATPAAENSGETAKLIASTASRENHQIELPSAASVGLCTVCMEGFEPSGEGNRLPCGHVFHGACIRKWLFLHNFCPLCRFDIAAAALRVSSLNTK